MEGRRARGDESDDAVRADESVGVSGLATRRGGRGVRGERGSARDGELLVRSTTGDGGVDAGVWRRRRFFAVSGEDDLWARYEAIAGPPDRWTKHRESCDLYYVAERTRSFFEWLATRPEENVVVSTHSALLRCLFSYGHPGGVRAAPEQIFDSGV